jgi:hypothetical protein
VYLTKANLPEQLLAHCRAWLSGFVMPTPFFLLKHGTGVDGQTSGLKTGKTHIYHKPSTLALMASLDSSSKLALDDQKKAQWINLQTMM